MIGALLLLGLGAAGASAADTTFTVAPGSRIVIEHPMGSIHVRGSRGREARLLVGGDASGAWVSSAGSVYRIGAAAPWELEDATLEVELPRDVELVIHGLEGDVSVSGIAGDVTVETIDGGIDVTGGADVRLETVDGDIRVEGASEAVSARTGDGDIDLVDTGGPIEAQTIDGDVRVTGSAADAVVISTISGDIRYEGSIAPGGTYALGSHDGDVVLVVPRGAGARVSVETFSGALEPSFPVQLGRGRAGASEFTIGDGGARVTLESFAGDIYLIRPGERAPGFE